MDCPTREELAACLLGRVADARADLMLEHAEKCAACAKNLDAVENASDHVTEALRIRTDAVNVSAECERMINRAEIYVQSEYIEEAVTNVKQHLLQGTKLRDYEILRPLGEGGMGAVFLAHHGRLDRDVALKVLSMRRAGDQEAQKRFEQEMLIVGKLQHPNIVRALDGGEHEGVQYLVMEVIDGVDLRQLVDALGTIPLADACEICRQAAEALAYAHGQQLIHRDVKPSNIMLSADGIVKVMDLGLARFTDQQRLSLTSTQQAMGSLDFMAPEQLRAEQVDQRADVYGLACTLHFLLMGEPPEKRRTASLMVSRNPKLEGVRGILPPPLTRLLQQMLAVDVNKRVHSLSEVAEELAPFCSRSDLTQLSLNAKSLTGENPSRESGSITSNVEKVLLPVDNSRLRWLVAGLLSTASLLAVVALPQLLTQGKSTAPRVQQNAAGDKDVVELDELSFVSSNVKPMREIPLFQVHEQAVRCVAFSETTSQLICGSDDGSISIRELPNQPRICVLNYFEKPVEHIAILNGGKKFVCQDQSGSISVFQLPTRELIWRSTSEDFQHRLIGVAGVAGADQLVAGFANGRLQAIDCSTQTIIRKIDVRKPIKEMRTTPQGDLVELTLNDGTRQWFSLADLSEAEPVEFGIDRGLVSFTVNGQGIGLHSWLSQDFLCAVDGTFARLVDSEDLGAEHYIYAEHGHPITAVFAFPDESMLLTADKSGEIRLWHAPGRPSSDMLMSTTVQLDSREMTFGLLHQKRWSVAAFSRTDLDEVMYNYSGSEMSIETEIRRDGQRHVLEYRIN